MKRPKEIHGGTLDIGVIRDAQAAWGGRYRWWKRYLPRRLWTRFGYIPMGSLFEEHRKP